MGQGTLQVKLYIANSAAPVKNILVVIKNVSEEVLHRLFTDNNGLTELVTLEAPNQSCTDESSYIIPCYSSYNIEIPASEGYKKIIIYGVQIFNRVASILPVQMEPAVIGDTPEQNTKEIYIPLEHGVSYLK